MRLTLGVVATGLALAIWPASAERIARVVDGDTVVTARGEKVRLMGFDSKRQPSAALR